MLLLHLFVRLSMFTFVKKSRVFLIRKLFTQKILRILNTLSIFNKFIDIDMSKTIKIKKNFRKHVMFGNLRQLLFKPEEK